MSEGCRQCFLMMATDRWFQYWFHNKKGMRKIKYGIELVVFRVYIITAKAAAGYWYY